nr:RNA polymerase sigma-70 factor [Bacteroides ovatus]
MKTKAIRYFQTDRTLTRIVSPPLYFAINLLKSEEDAEDIIQDVFAKLWTQPEVWLENKDIGQYIYAMTKNTTFNFIKRKRLEQSYQEQLSQKYLIEDLLKSEDTLDPIYYKEALLIIRLILDRLPERRRKVFEMSRINNMSNMEIAQALNISVRTVEHQIYLTLLEIKKTIFIAFFLCFF